MYRFLFLFHFAMHGEVEDYSDHIHPITTALKNVGKREVDDGTSHLKMDIFETTKGVRSVKVALNGSLPIQLKETSFDRGQRGCWIISNGIGGCGFFLLESNHDYKDITAGIEAFLLQGDENNFRPLNLSCTIQLLGFDPTLVNNFLRASCDGKDVVFVRGEDGNGVTFFKENGWIVAQTSKRTVRFREEFCKNIIEEIKLKLGRAWI